MKYCGCLEYVFGSLQIIFIVLRALNLVQWNFWTTISPFIAYIVILGLMMFFGWLALLWMSRE